MRVQPATLPILFIITFVVGCMPADYGVKHSYAYYRVVYPGNIPVRIPGVARESVIDTTTSVYVETTRKATPVWDTAWRKGIAYSVSTVPITEDSVNVGISKATSQPVFIKPKQGNRLWLVSLGDKITGTVRLDEQQNTTGMILGGSYRNKRITVAIPNTFELQPQRRP